MADIGTTDYSVPTLGISKKNLYFNPSFINGLDARENKEAKQKLDDAFSANEITQEDYDKFQHQLTYWYGKKEKERTRILLETRA